jgi:serine/threonine-protein kinase
MAHASCRSESDFVLRDFRLTTSDSGFWTEVRLPGHLDELVPKQPGEFSLVTTAGLPASMRGRDLEMGVACGSALWELSIAGEAMAPVLHDDLLERYRANGPRAFRIPARLTGKSTLELRMTVQQTWTQSTWFECPPTLAVSPPGLWAARTIDRLNEASMWMSMVTLCVLATYCLLLWMGNKQMRFAGLFAVQLGGATVVPIYELGLLQPLIGSQDTAAFALLMVVSMVVAIYSTNVQFQLAPPRWLWNAILCVNIVIIVVAGSPFSATKVVGPVLIATLLYGFSRNIAVSVRMYLKRRQRQVAVASILAWGSLLLLGTPDFVPWLGGGEPLRGLRLAPTGLTLYAIFLFMGMGTEYLRSLEHSDELNKQLAQQLVSAEKGQKEIQKLNDELRRQVAERSRQLLAALLPVDEVNGTMSKFSAGELIEGRYKIIREIASGGMGQVFEAVRMDDGRVLAIKVSLELDTNARARIVREAQVASRIVHPNLVSVMDVGVASTGYVYLVMEYADGTALDRCPQRFGEVEWGLGVLAQLCRALSALHSAGLVHRDLKPANVLLAIQRNDPTRPPIVKLGDFGISKSHHQQMGRSEPPSRRSSTSDSPLQRNEEETSPLKSAVHLGQPDASENRSDSDPPQLDLSYEVHDEIPDLTAAGIVLGTPMYVAPELASPWSEATPAADMYAFGVLVFNVLGRSSPFAQPLFYLNRAGQSYPPPCSIATACPALPDYLVEAIDACLSAEPSKRPSARRMGELMDRALEQLSTPRNAELS